MAEAFGIAGSAVGIVSLGLQLYGGITTYFDALEGREDDLASARAQLDSLRDSLLTIQSVLPAASTTGTHSSTIPPIVEQCKDELDRLDILLQEIAGSSTSSKKLKDRVKTLRFPFRRDSLMKLEDRLHKTNSVFQTALSVFHLNKSLGNEQKLANVEVATTQIPAINANVAQVSTELQGLRTDVAQISVDTNNTVTILHSNNTRVTSLADDFGAFAPEAMSRLSEVRQSLDTVARQDDIRELSRTSENNTDVLCRVDVSVAQMVATTESKLALIESSAQNSVSSNEQILQKLSNLENLLGLQGAEHPANSQAVLRRVFAKPSQTREILDSLSSSWAMPNHSGSSFQEAYQSSPSSKFQGPSCTCLRRKVRQGTSQNFGPFWLRTETSYDGHSRDCQLAKWQLGTQRRWFELTAARRSSFWSWALGVSFTITTGAGGLSISPSINYRPIVNEEKSPVFRVLSLLEIFLGSYSSSRLTETEISCCLSESASMILKLYQEKKAFPYEVNTMGKSAVHEMVLILCRSQSSHWREAFREFVTWAVEKADLPANICDFKGWTPVIQMALQNNYDGDSVLPTLSILYEKAPESVINYDMFKVRHFRRMHFWLLSCTTSGRGFGRIRSESRLLVHDGSETGIRQWLTVQVFGCGPIGTAILADYGEDQINELIGSMNIYEVSSFGQTPLHLAAGKGNVKALAALLRSPQVLANSHLQDVSGKNAIHYALYNSERYDDLRGSGFHPECNYSDALHMLLRVENCFDDYLENSINPWGFVQHLQSGSLRTCSLLMSELKLKRDRLKQLALMYLGREDIRRYKLDRDDVLDYYGIDVIEQLTDMGIKVPATLKAGFFKSARRHSIYHYLSQGSRIHQGARVLQLIFDLGFHDIEDLDEKGYTPLMMASRNDDTAIIDWFVKNGADPTLRIPRTTSKTDSYAHFNSTVAQKVTSQLRMWLGGPFCVDSETASLLNKVVPVDMTDDCMCYCTKDGCSPASVMFSRLWDMRKRYGRLYFSEPPEFLTEVVTVIAWWLETGSLDLMSNRPVCLAALRMLTFNALGISHTCGCRGSWEKLDSDEIEAIWDEEAHLIKILEDLQAEIETEFGASDMHFSMYLTTKWLPRLENVLRELDEHRLSEAERTGAEALGVRWQSQEVTQEPRQEEYAWPNNLFPRGLEDFFEILRGIGEE